MSHVTQGAVAPTVVLVTLANGAVAVFLNSVIVCSADEGGSVRYSGFTPRSIAQSLAKTLGVDLAEHEMDVPAVDNWCWDDVLAVLTAGAEEEALA